MRDILYVTIPGKLAILEWWHQWKSTYYSCKDSVKSEIQAEIHYYSLRNVAVEYALCR